MTASALWPVSRSTRSDGTPSKNSRMRGSISMIRFASPFSVCENASRGVGYATRRTSFTLARSGLRRARCTSRSFSLVTAKGPDPRKRPFTSRKMNAWTSCISVLKPGSLACTINTPRSGDSTLRWLALSDCTTSASVTAVPSLKVLSRPSETRRRDPDRRSMELAYKGRTLPAASMDAIFSKTQGYAMLTISASWTVGLGCPSRPHKATLKTNESRPCEVAQDDALAEARLERVLLAGHFVAAARLEVLAPETTADAHRQVGAVSTLLPGS